MMKRRAWLFATLGVLQTRAWAAPREVHGAHDAWAEPGLALAWGVLRGRDEASTRVVIRIEADAKRHAHIAATGRDPFGGGTVALPVQRGADGAVLIDVPRSHFAEHPRTELRFHAPGAAEVALLVYFQGVPDTTPESASAAQLEADLRMRIARARAQAPRR
jgi:hypothetical protein